MTIRKHWLQVCTKALRYVSCDKFKDTETYYDLFEGVYYVIDRQEILHIEFSSEKEKAGIEKCLEDYNYFGEDFIKDIYYKTEITNETDDYDLGYLYAVGRIIDIINEEE